MSQSHAKVLSVHRNTTLQVGSPFFQAQNNIKETLLASEVCDIFRYEVFTGRILLAALDHNFHIFCKTLCDVLSTHNSLGIKLLLRTAMLSTSCFKAVG